MTDSHPAHQDPNEVFLASTVDKRGRTQPPAQPQGTVYWIIGLVVVGLMVVAGFGTLIAAAVWYRLDRSRAVVADDSDRTVDDVRTRLQPVPPDAPVIFTSIFKDGPATNATRHSDYESIRTFALRLARVEDRRAAPDLLELVDLPRLVANIRQIVESRSPAPADEIDWQANQATLSKRLAGPIPFDYFLILRIDQPADDERVVWLHLWREGGVVRPAAWWLTRHSDQWKIYDWLDFDQGISKCNRLATLWTMTDADEAAGYRRFVELSNEYGEQVESRDNESRSRIFSILDECEDLQVPRRLYGATTLMTARRWYANGQVDRAERLLRRAGPWQQHTPGMLMLLGTIWAEREEYQAAISALVAYQQFTGPTASALKQIAQCQERLGQYAEALQTKRRLLAYDRSATSTTLFDVVTRVDDEEAQQIIREVAASHGGEALLQRLIEQLGRESFGTRELQIALPILQEEFPQAPATLACQALVMLANGQDETAVDRAIELLAESIRRSHPAGSGDQSDSDEQNRTRSMIPLAVDVASRVKRVGSLCEECRDRPEVPQYVLEFFDDEVWSSVTPDVGLRLADTWLMTVPNDSNALRLKAAALCRLGRWREASRVLKPLWDGLEEDSAERTRISSLLAECYCELRDFEALGHLVAHGLDPMQFFWILDAAGDVDGVTRLIVHLPQDLPQTKYLQAWVDFHEGRLAKAHEQCVDLIQRQDLGDTRHRVATLLIRIADAQGEVLSLLDSPVASIVAEDLDQFLRRTGDWSRLEQLVARLQRKPLPARDGEDTPLPWNYAKLNLLIWQHRYSEVVDMCLGWRKQFGREDRLSDSDLALLITYAIRVQRFKAAEALLDRMRDAAEQRLSAARIALYQGDDARLARLYPLLNSAQRSQLGVDIVEAQRPFSPMLLPSAPFVTRFSASPTAHVLLSADVDLAKVIDKAALHRVFGDRFEVQRIDYGTQPQTCVAIVPPYQVYLAAGPKGEAEQPIRRGDIRETVARSAQMVSITVVMDTVPNHENDASWRAFLLAREFARQGLLAVEYEYAWLLPAEIDKFSTAVELDQKTYWDFSASSLPRIKADSEEPLSRIRRRAGVFQLCWDAGIRGMSLLPGTSDTDEHSDTTDGGVFVSADLTLGDVRERLKFRVLAVKRRAGLEPVLTAELVDDSQWHLHLKAGQAFRLYLSEVKRGERAMAVP